MTNRAIPLFKGAVNYLNPDSKSSGLSLIPVREKAVITLPQLQKDKTYTNKYALTETELSVYRIYCKHKSNSEASGDGTVEHPYTNIDKALHHADCITRIAKCYWVQIVILGDSDVVRNEDWHYVNYLCERVIIGSTDGRTFFKAEANRESFDGILSQCELRCDIYVGTLLSCKIYDKASISCTHAINCECSNAYSFYATHMHSCICDSSFQGATSMNKCKIKLNSSETEHNISRLVRYVYDSEIDATTEFVNYSLFTADFIVNSTFSGIKIRCNKLLENSSIAMNFGEHIQSGVGIWGVSGHGDVIVNMGNNSIVKDTTITGKNKFKFTGSGRGYYGIIAVHSEQNCNISGVNISLSTSAVELDDFSGTNQHWSIISYTCAHALGTNPAKCVMGCDYKKVELHPEEGFDWAKPCTELYV